MKCIGMHHAAESRVRRGWLGRVSCLAAAVLLAVWPCQAKYGGGSGTQQDPYLIRTARDLVVLAADANDWNGHFRLVADIDMRAVGAEAIGTIGNEESAFSGTFDAGGRSIRHFTCIGTECQRVGLFGLVRGSDAEIRDLRLIEPNVVGGPVDCVGALVGQLSRGVVTGCRVEGAHVSGLAAVGALVGWNDATIVNCTAHGEVRGEYSIGGLVGVCTWNSSIRNCSANACVTGANRVGGLVGGCTLNTIEWCSADGWVAGATNVGGLVGCSDGGIVRDCYASASVAGVSCVGGLMGGNEPSCQCSIGRRPGEIHSSYSTGPVSGQICAGGLVGCTEDDCITLGSFWDVQTSGAGASAGGVGLTTTELQRDRTFVAAGWDFIPKGDDRQYWVIRRQPQYPRPAWQIVEGDLDDDGDIDLHDFGLLALHWAQPDVPFRLGGNDLAGDERIDTRDLDALCRRWLDGVRRPFAR